MSPKYVEYCYQYPGLKILLPTKVDGRAILETIADFDFEIPASLTIPANLYFWCGNTTSVTTRQRSINIFSWITWCQSFVDCEINKAEDPWSSRRLTKHKRIRTPILHSHWFESLKGCYIIRFQLVSTLTQHFALLRSAWLNVRSTKFIENLYFILGFAVISLYTFICCISRSESTFRLKTD